MLEQKFKYEENIKSNLAAKNELLSKRINELNSKPNDLQASTEHPGEVNLEKFKAIDRNMSHINKNFRNHAKYTDNHLYKTEGKLRYLEASS